jgi:hypothetical protein
MGWMLNRSADDKNVENAKVTTIVRVPDKGCGKSGFKGGLSGRARMGLEGYPQND